MKHATLAFSLAVVVGLVGCSTPMPLPRTSKAPQVEAPVHAAVVTQFEDRAVNEAASAYVSLYKQTIEQSLADQAYKSELAFKHLSAEACFDSRANRLLARELTRAEKDALVLSHVSQQKLADYAMLSQGHFARVNGLELFSCDTAGLKVAQLTLKN